MCIASDRYTEYAEVKGEGTACENGERAEMAQALRLGDVLGLYR